MDDVRIRFEKALSDFGIGNLIDKADRIIIGFSGGADSRVLLSLLKEYTHERKEIICAHVNHMIRGEDADRDEMNCVEWANEYGVPIRISRIDVPTIAKREGKGIEETARNVRYGFFDSLVSEFNGVSLIATAHNADDNLETVLFNLLRGSGTHGMTGIPPVRDGKYIRPLILCSSSLIRDYCRKNGISYNIDQTNTDTEYTRNYIRNRIVPLLGTITNDPVDSVSRMCSILRADDDYILSAADSFIDKNGCGTQSLDKLLNLHNAVLSRVIERLYRFAGGKRTLSKTHVDSVIDAIRNKKGTVFLSLPDGIFFTRSGESVYFSIGRLHCDGIEGAFHLKVDGEPFVFGDVAVAASTNPLPTLFLQENIYNLSIHKLTNFDKIKGDIFIRGRVDGDSFRFGGITRKVKKLFSEKKIPFDKRNRLPIIADNDGIIWIPGFPLRDGVSPSSVNGNESVWLCFYEKELKKDFER